MVVLVFAEFGHELFHALRLKTFHKADKVLTELLALEVNLLALAHETVPETHQRTIHPAENHIPDRKTILGIFEIQSSNISFRIALVSLNLREIFLGQFDNLLATTPSLSQWEVHDFTTSGAKHNCHGIHRIRVCTPETVDGLVFVANHNYTSVFVHGTHDQMMLDLVQILRLVNCDNIELWSRKIQNNRQPQLVRESDGASALLALFQKLWNGIDHLLGEILGHADIMLFDDFPQVVLVAVDHVRLAESDQFLGFHCAVVLDLVLIRRLGRKELVVELVVLVVIHLGSLEVGSTDPVAELV